MIYINFYIKTYKHHLSIIYELNLRGKLKEIAYIEKLPEDLIRRQYDKLSGYSFLDSFVREHSGKPAIIAVYEGNITEFAKLKKEIRQKYKQLRGFPELDYQDIIHFSDSIKEYNQNIFLWRSYFNESS